MDNLTTHELDRISLNLASNTQMNHDGLNAIETDIRIPNHTNSLNESHKIRSYHQASNRASQPHMNAARERTRVKTLRSAFHDLQRALPSVPHDTKLSKLDVLVLATSYIRQLMFALETGQEIENLEHANEASASAQCEDGSNLKINDIAQHSAENGTTNQRYAAGFPGKFVLLPKSLPWFHKTGSRISIKDYYHPVKKWPMRFRLYAGMRERARERVVYKKDELFEPLAKQLKIKEENH